MKRETEERKKNEQQKGITLIALVVTIVVLLILAGVSLNLVLGNNGIITKAKDAVKKAEEARVKEEFQLKMAESWIDANTKENIDIDILDELGIVGINKITVTESILEIVETERYVVLNVVVENNGKYYNVDFDLQQNDFSTNVTAINELPEEALVAYKLIKDDEDLEMLSNGVCKYNNKIFSATRDVDIDMNAEGEPTGAKVVAYVQISEPMKIRINSGTDGVIDFETSSKSRGLGYLPYIEWGDGATESDSDSLKHVYGQPNTEYVISLHGTVNILSIGDTVSDNQILAIEDWGNSSRLYGLYLAGATNLKTLAKPGEQTFKINTNFSGAFANCTSLQSIPEGFFDSAPYVQDFSGAFYNCTSLTGNAPRLWERVKDGVANEYIGIPNGSGCFAGCNNLNNYAEIPDYWKKEEK